MKSLTGAVTIVFAILLNSIEGQQQDLSPIRTFQYRPAVHTDMANLMINVNGKTMKFNALTTLVARGAILFGWLNNQNIIEPIFIRHALVTYNLDEQVASVTSKRQLTAYGVYGELPVGPWYLDPIRTFQYRPALHTYLAPLRKKSNGQEVQFDADTILVARGANLFGWLNNENVIEPIFLRKRPAMFNLDEHMPTDTNVSQLMLYGILNKLPVVPSEDAQPAESRSRSRNRSPLNQPGCDAISTPRPRRPAHRDGRNYFKYNNM